MNFSERWICRKTRKPISGPRVCQTNKAIHRAMCEDCVNEAQLDVSNQNQPGAASTPLGQSARPETAAPEKRQPSSPPAGAAAPGKSMITQGGGPSTPEGITKQDAPPAIVAPAPAPGSRRGAGTEGGACRCLECGADLGPDRLGADGRYLMITVKVNNYREKIYSTRIWPICSRQKCLDSAFVLMGELAKEAIEIMGSQPAKVNGRV